MLRPLERTNCYLCGNDISVKLCTISGFRQDPREYGIVQCTKCYLVYTNPRCTQSENYEMYQRGYYADTAIDPSGKVRSFLSDKPNKIKDHKLEIGYIRKFKKEGNILDFGCALGYFLEALDGNWKKYGVDISEFAIDNMTAPDVVAHMGTLLDAKYEDSFFDVIYAGHTLDRLIDVKENIRELKRILKKDGVVLVTTPNIGSVCSRVFKEKFRLLYSNHLIYFSPETIAKAFAEFDMTVVEVRYPYYATSHYSHGGAIVGSLKIATQALLNACRVNINMVSPPYWGNVMSVLVKHSC